MKKRINIKPVAGLSATTNNASKPDVACAWQTGSTNDKGVGEKPDKCKNRTCSEYCRNLLPLSNDIMTGEPLMDNGRVLLRRKD